MNKPVRSVVFLGPDGAGKTTLINLVEKRLEARGINPKCYYFAPGYLKRYRSTGQTTVTTNPHEGRQYNAGLVFAKILLMLLEFNMGFPKVKRSNGLVLFDRFIHDLLVDPQRYRMGRVRWWMGAMLKLAPMPDLCVIITAPASVIQSRKQEVTHAETARQIEAYKSLAALFPRAMTIENTGQPDGLVKQIVAEIMKK